ncbi:MAG: hypothetical protein FJY97_20035 [candidate division Zixibacteria bacterium]|nr:hypothetical protein [candidate division Zixibacteria bacterium]
MFLGLSLALALMGGEALLRILDRAQPEQTVNIIKPEDIDLSFNTNGFRDRDYAKEKPFGVFRILVLGNSATFGVSVASGQTYVKQLEERLNTEGEGIRFEVMNAGVPSWNMSYQEKYLETEGLAFQPDMVMVGFTLNTAETHYIPPEDLFSSKEKYQGDPEVLHRNPREWAKPLLENKNRTTPVSTLASVSVDVKIWLSNHSSLYRYVWWRYDLTRQPFDTVDYPNSLYDREAHIHWDVCRKAIEDMGQTLKARNIPGVMVIFPMFFGLRPAPRSNQTYPWENLHGLIAKAAIESGMIAVDTLPIFKKGGIREISA